MEQKPDPLFRGLSALLEGRKTGIVLNLLIVVLVILALLLPPVSAQERILDAGFKTIDRDAGGTLHDRAEPKVQLDVFPDGLQKDVKVKLETVPKQVFNNNRKDQDLIAAAQALPTNMHVKSDIYQIDHKGDMPSAVLLTVPIPNDSEPYQQLSLYNWTGQEWEFLPSQVIPEDDEIEARLDYLPRVVAVVQTTWQAPLVSAELPDYVTLPESGQQALAELNPVGYYLDWSGDDVKIAGQLATLPASQGEESYQVLPNLRNWTEDGVVRSDWIDNLLITPDKRDAHIAAIVDLAVREMYAGIDLDYRGMSADLEPEFTTFVADLAAALHDKGKQLTVHVDAPVQVSADQWDTGAFNWRAIGQAADRVKFAAIQNPAAYAPGGQMEQLLWWAIGQVDRAKLQPVFTARSVEDRGGVLVERTYRDALAEMCRVTAQGASDVLTPGQEMKVELQTAGVAREEQTGCYTFSYTDEASGQARTVWLEDANSLARKLALTNAFSVGGVGMRALWDEGNDTRVWDLVREYQASSQMAQAPADSQFAILWTVANNGTVVKEETTGLDRRSYSWTAQDPGQYTFVARILGNDGKTVAGGSQVAYEVALPTATPTPLPTDTPVPTETPVPTAAPTRTSKPAGSGAVKPAATAKPSNPGGSGAKVNTNFGYGIQIDAGDDLGWAASAIKGMGFGWVKFQAPWKDFEGSKGAINWGNMDSKVNGLGGLKVMLSIVKAPAWARSGQDMGVEGPPNNPQDFADFLGQVAGRYCNSNVKAIEVWNEQNLHYEWGNKPISPADYMNLLKPAYNAIKRACPGMIVVSGALTPTGAPPPRAMDDYTYLEGMYKNGLKNFCDAVGAHPSGYNVAPWIKGGQDACNFITQQGSSFRGPCNTLHHSWSFYATLNGYHSIMSKYGDGGKKIWPTEFGWATDWIGDPSYGYASDNSREEQAAWTVKSYELMRSWGFVGVAFLWNLNFKVTGNGNECSQWGIVGPDRTPLQTYNALKGMAK